MKVIRIFGIWISYLDGSLNVEISKVVTKGVCRALEEYIYTDSVLVKIGISK